MRHRIVRTQGRMTKYVDDEPQAKALAEAWYAAWGIPVAVCEAPEGGIVRHLYTVGAEPRRRTHGR